MRTTQILIAVFVAFLVGIAPITFPNLPARIVEYIRPPHPPEATFIAVGDIMLSRAVAKKMRAHGASYPFAETSLFLNAADITFGNLETSITEGRSIEPFEMTFRADPESTRALKDAGFDILSLANNHTSDFGHKGLLDTLLYLDREGIVHVGAGKDDVEAGQPMFVTAQGIRFAFLAYTDQHFSGREAESERAGSAFMRIERMQEAVGGARTFADIVIVSMHAGNEYEPEPNEFQQAFARAAIDAGATMVIGHHPHVVQTAEVYKGNYIFYSLGNFVFDQMWSQSTREGLILKVVFSKEGVKNISYHPILIEDYAQPHLLFGEEADRVTRRLSLEPVDTAKTTE